MQAICQLLAAHQKSIAALGYHWSPRIYEAQLSLAWEIVRAKFHISLCCVHVNSIQHWPFEAFGSASGELKSKDKDSAQRDRSLSKQLVRCCGCRYDKDIRSLVLNSSLASIAAQLLNSRNLRLYQDCVFLKHPGFSETHWHSDCPLSPLDTSAFVTAWIPLRPIQACPLAPCTKLQCVTGTLSFTLKRTPHEQPSLTQFHQQS